MAKGLEGGACTWSRHSSEELAQGTPCLAPTWPWPTTGSTPTDPPSRAAACTFPMDTPHTVGGDCGSRGGVLAEREGGTKTSSICPGLWPGQVEGVKAESGWPHGGRGSPPAPGPPGSTGLRVPGRTPGAETEQGGGTGRRRGTRKERGEGDRAGQGSHHAGGLSLLWPHPARWQGSFETPPPHNPRSVSRHWPPGGCSPGGLSCCPGSRDAGRTRPSSPGLVVPAIWGSRLRIPGAAVID